MRRWLCWVIINNMMVLCRRSDRRCFHEPGLQRCTYAPPPSRHQTPPPRSCCSCNLQDHDRAVQTHLLVFFSPFLLGTQASGLTQSRNPEQHSALCRRRVRGGVCAAAVDAAAAGAGQVGDEQRAAGPRSALLLLLRLRPHPLPAVRQRDPLPAGLPAALVSPDT